MSSQDVFACVAFIELVCDIRREEFNRQFGGQRGALSRNGSRSQEKIATQYWRKKAARL